MLKTEIAGLSIFHIIHTIKLEKKTNDMTCVYGGWVFFRKYNLEFTVYAFIRKKNSFVI